MIDEVIVMPSKIKKRGKNSYQLFVPDGYDTAGKQQGFTKTVIADNPTEAKKLYDLFLSECLQGKVLTAGTEKMTLTQFYEYWKDKFAIARYAKTTMACYNQVFIRIDAALGHLRIDKIKPIQMVDFFAQLSKPDAKKNDTAFTERSIGKYRELLQLLFSTALKWELITANPMEKLDKPRTRKKHKEMPSQEEVIAFFEHLSKAPLKNQLMCMLAFAGGLRREEFSALQQGDFNTEKNAVKIQRAATYIPGEGIHVGMTKTDNSERTISLPPSVMRLRESYNAELKEQAMRRAKRNKVVLLDDPIGPTKWLFSQPDGSIGHTHALNSFLKSFCAEHDLFNFTPHLLRHLHGSYLLRNGMDIAAVSKSLGHSKKSFTLDTYIHTIETIENETAAVMKNVLSNLKSQANKEEPIKKC